jgi:DNA-binding transcriptional MocR family regulator
MSPARRKSGSRNVVARISEELGAQVRSGALPPGTALPSVRQLARDRDVSPFSAAAVYDGLVASGLIEARAGLGYFVPSRRPPRIVPIAAPVFPTDSIWERRREARAGAIAVDAGAGWLPGDWLHGEGVRAALRAIARLRQLKLEGYGNPFGLGELRAHLSGVLDARGIAASEDQIVLTQGASQALDLIVRECLAPGDVVIVEDPGYPPTFEMLRQRGVKMLAVPRTASGPDTDALEKLLRHRRARGLIVNTCCHNPTGTTMSSASAHRVLELANRHDLLLIEDDIFADLAPQPLTTLASLDELNRVIYLSSFSKTVSPALRAGYLAAAPKVAQRLARAKATISLGSSELLERLLLRVLTHGHYRRHLKGLRSRLAAAHLKVARELQARGVELAFRPQSGLFLWARLPSTQSVSKLWQLALAHDVLLAPGEMFRPDGRACPQWRFNVAHCDAPALYRFVDSLGAT